MDYRTKQLHEMLDESKNKIIDLYVNNNIPAKQIGRLYGCSYGAILRQLDKWGIERHERPNSIYKLNSHYFDNIDTEHKAYWYGFLFADGHVNDKVVMLTLQIGDKDMIEAYAKDLETDIPISYVKDNAVGLNIACKTMCNSLLEKGFNHRKSYDADIREIASYVPDELVHHFIRGMFDGDGCVAVYKYDYLKSPQTYFGYTGLHSTCEYIGEILGIDNKILRESENGYTIKTADKYKITNIFNYLYNDATIYMNRKYEKFKKIELITFNDYNNGIQVIG